MLDSMKRNGLRLATFALATTAVVSITYALTADTIAKQEQKQLLQVLNQVVPSSQHDNDLPKSCILLPSQTSVTPNPMPAYIAKQGDKTTAIAIETYAPDGYSGAIKLIVGMDLDSNVLGVRVLQHKETPGLGDRIDLTVSDWILGFTGKTLNDANISTWAVRKDGGDFDQFTGATITPRAVVKAVKNTILYFQQDKDKILATPIGCEG